MATARLGRLLDDEDTAGIDTDGHRVRYPVGWSPDRPRRERFIPLLHGRAGERAAHAGPVVELDGSNSCDII